MRYPKNTQINTERRQGFTLVEVVVSSAACAIVTFSIGAILVGSQKQWSQLNTRVNGNITTGAYAATGAFDAVCRKSTWKTCELTPSQDDLTLYYYHSESTSVHPEKYARFYLDQDQLRVQYGDLKSGEWTADPSITPNEVLLADNIQSLQFSIQGKAVSMCIQFNPNTNAPPVNYTAVRNNN
jgi:hypothetical protein